MTNPPAKPQSAPPPRPKRWRRWVFGALGLILGTVIGALPSVLSSERGRRWLLSQADGALAPGRLALGSIEVSWFGPTRMTGLVLHDHKGEAVVQAEKATWDRGLWHAFFELPKLGTLTLDNAMVDAEREPDGTIDLYETLRPVLRHNKRMDLRVVITDGRLRFRSEGLEEPVSAEHMNFVLEVVPAPNPLRWHTELANGPSRSETETLTVDGSFDHWRAREGVEADLAIEISGRDWPWTIALPDGQGAARGRLSGTLAVGCEQARWQLSGDAALVDLSATLPRLGDNPLNVGRVVGKWNLARETSGDWSIERLELSGKDPQGRWSATAKGRSNDSGLEVATDLGLELRAGEGEREPVRLNVLAALPRSADRIERVKIAATSLYGRIDASGKLDAPEGRHRAALIGTVSPNWEAINARLKSTVEPAAEISGGPSALELAIDLSEDWRSSLAGRIGFNVEHADLFGLKLGPTEVVLRAREGKLSIDQIDTVLNGGKVHLAPKLVLDDDAGPLLKFGPDSRLDDIEVNDEVSQRVLAFAAPVLERATRVRGRVSAEFKEAIIPLGRSDRHEAEVQGNVIFQDVAFRAGSFTGSLFDLVGIEGPELMRLNQPVALRIADRKVYQKGLAMPLPGNVSRVEVEGWVGFDRALALTVSLPVTPAMVANQPVLRKIVDGARVRVEIGGTLDRPAVNKEALNVALRDLGRTLLDRAVMRGLPSLFMKPFQRREPPAPAPPPFPPAQRPAGEASKDTPPRENP